MSKTTYYSQQPATFSREWWLRAVRTFFWVGAVTVLIFVWADVEFTDEREYHATVRLTTGSENLLLLSDREIQLTFRLAGSQSQLTTFGDLLNQSQGRMNYDISRRIRTEGEHTLNTEVLIDRGAARLLGRGSLEEAGIRLTAVAPGSVYVQADRRILVEDIPVQFQHAGAELAGPSEIVPATVNIRVSESRWQEFMARVQADEAKPRIETRAVDLQAAVNTEETQRVELAPAVSADLGGEEISVPVEPVTRYATVTYRIRSRVTTDSYKVTVRVLCPHGWANDGTWETYRLEANSDFWWQQEIEVRGPQEDLERLEARDIDAYIVLTEASKAPIESYQTLPVLFRFPPELDVSLVGPPPTVQVRMSQQQAAGS